MQVSYLYSNDPDVPVNEPNPETREKQLIDIINHFAVSLWSSVLVQKKWHKQFYGMNRL